MPQVTSTVWVDAAFAPRSLGTSKLTNYAHKNNIAVQYWTINDAEDITMLKEINADCIMSDVPDVAYNILNNK